MAITVKGEVKSAKVSRKLDESNREITVIDIRVKVPMNEKAPVRELLDLTGHNVNIEILKAQLSTGL